MWVPYKFSGSHVNFNQSKECVRKSVLLTFLVSVGKDTPQKERKKKKKKPINDAIKLVSIHNGSFLIETH